MITLFKFIIMTQDEKWLARFNEVMRFIETNHRNPSKYNLEERNMFTFCKHSRKQMNQGLLKPERVALFQKYLELSEQYRRKNQYQWYRSSQLAAKASSPLSLKQGSKTVGGKPPTDLQAGRKKDGRP